MNESAFLLSLCIPTCNRASKLRENLEHLAAEKSFYRDREIEIVLSDNASDDETWESCLDFQHRFPDRCVIRREPERIDSHLNFQHALESGSGKFLKLQNDNVLFAPGALADFLDFVRAHQDQASVFIPLSASEKLPRGAVSFDDMLYYAGLSMTWISSFCVRRSSYAVLAAPFRCSHLNLPQFDILLRLAASGEKVMFVENITQYRLHVAYLTGNKNKNPETRNDAKIFGKNYFDLMEPYVEQGSLTGKTFEHLKKEMLWKHIIPFHFDFFHQYFAVPQHGFLKYCYPHYRKKAYFYWALLYIGGYYFCSRIIPLHQLCGMLRKKLLRAK